VRSPFRYREVLARSTPLRRALRFIVPAAIVAVVLNLPKFFEIKARKTNEIPFLK
jgi:hypothetical protein